MLDNIYEIDEYEQFILEEIKKIQGINHTEFDYTIINWIKSSKIDLQRIGIVMNNPDNLITTAIITYVLSFIDVPNAELYAKSYALQKDVLRHTKEYLGEQNAV